MSNALKRAAEVTAVIADLKDGTEIAANWLASVIDQNPERADSGLSHPTLAVRVTMEDGKPTGKLDIYDRTRPMTGQSDYDFRLELDTMLEREVSPTDVLRFLHSNVWLSVVTSRELVKRLITSAKA